VSDPFVSLLPPSASKLERALEQSFKESLDGISIPIRSLWNPDTCPLSVLPWLAWAFSVDSWEPSWTEAQQRSIVKNSLIIHKYKGTIGAVKRALDSIGYQWEIVEWWQDTPKGDPYTFRIDIHVRDRAITDVEYDSIFRIIQDTKNVRSKLDAMVVTNDTFGKLYASLAVISGCEDELFPYVPGELINAAYLTFLSAVMDGETTEIYPRFNVKDLLRIEDSEISMLCIDGSDGKDNAYQIIPVVSGEGMFNPAYASSDNSVAIVSADGIVSGVANTGSSLSRDVTISCSWKGITASCLVTVYATLPSIEERYAIKGGSGPDITGINSISCQFSGQGVLDQDLGSGRLVCKLTADSTQTMPIWQASSSTGYKGIRIQSPHYYYGYRWIIQQFQVPNASYTRENIINPGHSNLEEISADLSVSASGLYNNGLATTSNVNNVPDSNNPDTFMIFANQVRKIVESAAGSSLLTVGELNNRTFAKLLFIPQNYIRKTDHSGIVNRVVIPNIGALGNAFDMEQINVPSLWFSI